mgnify:CR=1 FL=1
MVKDKEVGITRGEGNKLVAFPLVHYCCLTQKIMFRNRVSISDYYRNSFEKIKSDILKENDATIIGTDEKELAEYYFQKYALSPIQFDETKHQSKKIISWYVKQNKAISDSC